MKLSEYTPEKQRILTGLVGWHVGMCSGIYQRARWADPYLAIDINASDGSGSPQIFRERLERERFPWEMFLIEESLYLYPWLEAMMADSNRITCYQGDHRAFLPPICESIGKKHYGLIYHDPTGIPSFDLLADVSRLPSLSRIDILINCPATAIKRSRRRNEEQQHIQQPNLAEQLARINKKYWLVRAPYAQWQWTFLFGTNYKEVGEWRNERLYRVDTEAGRDILERLALTTAEREALYGNPYL